MLAAMERNARACELLIDHRADVHRLADDIDAPLSLAAMLDDQVLSVLLRHGADPNVCRRAPPLNVACAADSLSRVRRLLVAGADVNAIAENGEHALSVAARMSNAAIAQTLLEAGADVNAADPTTGETAVDVADHFADSNERSAVIRLLRAAAAARRGQIRYTDQKLSARNDVVPASGR